MKLPPLRLAGANFWPKKIYPSCQILTNLALCALNDSFPVTLRWAGWDWLASRGLAARWLPGAQGRGNILRITTGDDNIQLPGKVRVVMVY